jgi:hypothetical protein
VGKGGEGRSWVGLGREGIGVWPTQKLSRGAPCVPCNCMVPTAKFSCDIRVNLHKMLWERDMLTADGAIGYILALMRHVIGGLKSGLGGLGLHVYAANIYRVSKVVTRFSHTFVSSS